ncbi:chloramphenicol resistance protein [Xylaria nigripes]|nr:chloramphenicol resistance protein [Xylaria nigripes]
MAEPSDKLKVEGSQNSHVTNDVEVALGGNADEESYSVFSTGEQRLVTAIIGLCMIFSPLTANIYFPGLVQIQENLNTTPEFIQLTITSYLVVQAISPVLFGDAADTYGRRPVFVIMFSVYVLANMALALQNSAAALLILRMVQSLGCSATMAISYGVIADVSTPAERGTMQGLAITAANLGPVLAPAIGGALMSREGWHSVFWFLMIAGGVVLILILIFLPETARSMVDNGKILPSKWRRPLASTIFGLKIPKAGQPSQGESSKAKPVRMLNPLRSFRILLYKDSSWVLLMGGIFYLIYYCVQASMPDQLSEIYGFGESTIGACYASIGGGVIVGGFANGKLMNYNYKQKAREIGHTLDLVKGDDLRKFPIEQARLRSMVFFNVAHLATIAAYGWFLQRKVHVSGPLILQFLVGFLDTCIVQTFSTLLVDIFQETPSTAAAAGNIVRCGLAAASIAAMKPLMNRMGYGWYFTMLSIVGFVIGSIGCVIVHKFGMKWRLQRGETTQDEVAERQSG